MINPTSNVPNQRLLSGVSLAIPRMSKSNSFIKVINGAGETKPHMGATHANRNFFYLETWLVEAFSQISDGRDKCGVATRSRNGAWGHSGPFRRPETMR